MLAGRRWLLNTLIRQRQRQRLHRHPTSHRARNTTHIRGGRRPDTNNQRPPHIRIRQPLRVRPLPPATRRLLFLWLPLRPNYINNTPTTRNSASSNTIIHKPHLA